MDDEPFFSAWTNNGCHAHYVSYKINISPLSDTSLDSQQCSAAFVAFMNSLLPGLDDGGGGLQLSIPQDVSLIIQQGSLCQVQRTDEFDQGQRMHD